MKKLIIPLHSFVDVVTNSSTMIYVMPNEGSVSAMYDIIDEILKVSWSEKKAKDLFDVYYEPTLDEEEVVGWDTEKEDYTDTDKELIAISKKKKITEEEYCKLTSHFEDNGENKKCANIIVISKEEGSDDLMGKIMWLFSIEESYE